MRVRWTLAMRVAAVPLAGCTAMAALPAAAAQPTWAEIVGPPAPLTDEDQGYAALDRAQDLDGAFSGTEPDRSLRALDTEAFIWLAADGSSMIVEPSGSDSITYYFDPDAARPFFVRAQRMAFAFDEEGRLDGVFGEDAALIPPDRFTGDPQSAEALRDRGAALLEAASGGSYEEESDPASDWSAYQPSFSLDVSAWFGRARRQPDWSAWHRRHRADPRRAQWRDAERRRRSGPDGWEDRGARPGPPGAGGWSRPDAGGERPDGAGRPARPARDRRPDHGPDAGDGAPRNPAGGGRPDRPDRPRPPRPRRDEPTPPLVEATPVTPTTVAPEPSRRRSDRDTQQPEPRIDRETEAGRERRFQQSERSTVVEPDPSLGQERDDGAARHADEEAHNLAAQREAEEGRRQQDVRNRAGADRHPDDEADRQQRAQADGAERQQRAQAEQGERDRQAQAAAADAERQRQGDAEEATRRREADAATAREAEAAARRQTAEDEERRRRAEEEERQRNAAPPPQ